jgi:N-acyl-D-amino-acid deacylase
VAQGITTCIGGNCGLSPAPLAAHYTSCNWWDWNWWEKVAPTKYYQEILGDIDDVRKASMEVDGVDIDWKSLAEFLERVENSRPAVNLGVLVGHGTIRTAVMGRDWRRGASAEEIRLMKWYAARAMEEGALGISNGLDYAPNNYSCSNESYEVIAEAVKKGGWFASHWRRRDLRPPTGKPVLADGLREAIDIAEKAGARLQVSHLSAAYSVWPAPTERLSALIAEETLAMIDEAASQGIEISFDCIPSDGGGFYGKYMASMLTPWLKVSGSLEQLAINLRRPEVQDDIREYITSGKWFYLNPVTNPGWAHSVRIIESDCAEYVGRTLHEISLEQNSSALDTLMHLITRDPRIRSASSGSSYLTKRIFFSHPKAMPGVDAITCDLGWEVRVPPYLLPDPGAFGGMATFIRKYGQTTLGIEETVHKMTGLPASVAGLSDRGVLAPGYKADVVVFSPEEVSETGDYVEPRRYPRGFEWVFVNGEAVVSESTLTGCRPGHVLRRACT